MSRTHYSTLLNSFDTLIIRVISDDISLNSLLIGQVRVAALLRRYSPLPHPLLGLLSYVPALPYCG